MSESPVGEADLSTESDLKGVTVCPTCGKDGFSREGTMKSHHKQVHGESISGVHLECDWCGDGHRRTRTKAESSEKHFCDDECYGKWKSQNRVGEDHPNWKGGKETTTCKVCGVEFEHRPQRDAIFCSPQCKGEYQGEIYEQHPPRGEPKTETICENCGEPFKHHNYLDRVFCSEKCHNEWQSGKPISERTAISEQTYGPNWEQKREERLEYDGYECVVCGVNNSRHKKAYGFELDVHHIQKKSEFVNDGVLDYEAANSLNNLVTLCRSCHTKWEGIPLRPQ